MAINQTVESGEARAARSLTSRFVLVAPAAEGVGSCFELERGADPGASVGYGLFSEQAAHHMKLGASAILAPSEITTVGTIGAVTKTGAGPSITVGLTDGYTSPTDKFDFIGEVTTAGAGPTAQLSYCLDGGTARPYVLDIPAEAPAVITGTVDIRYGATLSGLTLIFTAPTSDTVTFGSGSLAASTTSLKAATATVAAPVTYTAADFLAAGVAAVNAAHGAKIVITTAGGTAADAPATATFSGNIEDGSADSEVLNLSQIAGAATTTKRWRLDADFSVTLAAGDGVGATLAWGNVATFSDPADIVADFNAKATTEGLAVQSRAAEQSTGEVYFELYSTSAGSGVTSTIDATSTADTVLGVSGSSTGAAATVAIPYTGVTLTCPASSDYVLDTSYSFSTTAPRSSIEAILAAAAIPRAQALSFGEVVVFQPADTAGNCLALADALDTLVGGWHDDAAAPIGPTWSIQAPLHTPSAVLATSDAAIAAADTATKNALVAHTSKFGEICNGDAYVTGSKIRGSFRRGAVLPVNAIGSAIRLSRDAGNAGDMAGVSLVHPDGVTQARDENRATVRMGTKNGPGFTTLRRRGASGTRCAGRFSRAGAASRLFRFPIARAAFYAADLLRDLVQGFELADWQLDPTGKLRAADAEALGRSLSTSMRERLVLPPTTHFSSVSVAVDTAEKMSDTDNITFTATCQQRGYSEDVTFTVSVVGAVTTTTIAA